MVRSQGRGPDWTLSASEGHWKIEGRAVASIKERDHMQHQVQRAPGRVAVRALSTEFRLGGKSPKERRWGGEQERTKAGEISESSSPAGCCRVYLKNGPVTCHTPVLNLRVPLPLSGRV